MNIHVKTNGSAKQTGPLMRYMVETFYRDMLPYASLTLSEVFSVVKNIPYKEDPPNEETLQRPLFTLQGSGLGGDCDDKSICIAAWAKLQSIPYRFIAVQDFDHDRLHHVFCELKIIGQWFTVDPTYSFNTLGRKRKEEYKYYEII